MPINWWKDKQMWYSDTVECYLSIKSEVMLSATAWMNLESIIFIGKRSQSEKTTFYMIPLIWNIQNYISTFNRDRKQVSYGWRERRNEELLMSSLLFEAMKRFKSSKWMVVQLCDYTKKIIKLYSLKRLNVMVCELYLKAVVKIANSMW